VRGPDGRPIAQALVLARDEQPGLGGPPWIARTDDAGHFRINVQPSRSYLLRVEFAGLAAATVRHVRTGAPVAVTLARGASLEGIVRDSGGTPVADATVEAREEIRTVTGRSIDPESGVVRATTDPKGRFRLEGLAPGLHTLTAFARGLGRAERRGAATGKPVELSLVPGGAVTGVVTDVRGKAVAGALVRAISAMNMSGRGPLQMRSDDRGAFAIHGVPSGPYRVVATHADFAFAVVESVSVERDAESRTDVVLPPATLVRGRLLAPGDKPTRGTAALRQTGGEPVPDIVAGELVAEAGEDGLFALRAGPGSHVVEIVGPALAARRIDVDVPSGAPTVDLGDLPLESGITIRGRVKDAAGHPIEGATLFTWSPETSQSFRATSEADGSYVLAGLPAGLLSVSASATGMGRADRKAEAGASGVDFVLKPGGSVTGAVADETGKAIEGFRVNARLPSRAGMMGGRADSFAAPDGRFVLDDIAEGEYVVDVTAPERVTAVFPGVKVAAGAAADIGTVRLGTGGIVKGLVVDGSAAPVAGASVWVMGPGRDFSRMPTEITTDSGGAFEARGVTPGSAQVRATHVAYAPAAATTIEVDPSRGPAEVRIVLTQGGRIEGRVRSREGVPAGAVVNVRPMGPGAGFYSPAGPGLQPVAPDGSFVLEHVPAGRVSVVLMAGQNGRYQGGTQVQAEVREGETTSVEIALRNIAVSGKVTRGGAPLVGARVEFHSRESMGMYFGGGNDPAALPPNVGITREDGSYDLVAAAAGETFVEIQTPDRKTRLPAPTVQVPDADTYVADFNFTGAFVDGIVADKETEQPIAGAWVGAQPADPKTKTGYGSAESSADGRFHLELDPGEYRITARGDGYAVEAQNVTVADSGTSGVRFALGHGLAIKGRVVDAAGRGIGGLMVNGVTGEGRSRSGAMGRTLSDGSFEMAGLVDAPYTLTTLTDGQAFGILLDVSPGGEAVRLVVRPGGRVRVKVSGAGGAPVPGAGVIVSRVQGRTFSGYGYGAQTDSSGQAEFAAPAGEIELTARGKDVEGKTTVTVPVGGTAAAEITLGPAKER
jgi:protocatechuate 3,4-dioxygenase beta subunit